MNNKAGLIFLLNCCIWAAEIPAQTSTGFGKQLITVEECTATHTPEIPALSIYPNPAQEAFWVKSSGESLTFEVFDLLGNKMLSRTLALEEQAEIQTNAWPSGIYLVHWNAQLKRGTIFLAIGIRKG